ncbi:MAG: cell division protein ZapA [Spirochaetia bacterium]|nr:cell division protein ZapA [Spirochaetia bacterium]
MKNPISINLLGTSFTIQVDEDPEYIKQIISYLEERINKTRNAFPKQEPLKISLLACIFLIDELFRERNYSKEEQQNASAVAESLIDRLDSVLDN